MSPIENGWNEWSRQVLAELERLNDCYAGLDGRLKKIEIGLATLKTEFQFKAGLWGAIAGAIPVIIGIALWILKAGIK